MAHTRSLLVIADDLGIGPDTTRGIVELARAGVVTAAVLQTNSPHAVAAAQLWQAARPPADLGWHPCLTLDAPAAPAGQVASLLGPDGLLMPLRRLVPRLLLGLVRPEHIRRELEAQYRRFHDLTGHAPPVVNAHQHVAVFGRVGPILRDVLRRQSPRPYLRQIREPWRTLRRVPGARFKRACLCLLGRWQSFRAGRDCFAAADWLAGVTDPPWVRDPEYFARWLAHVPGRVVEFMVHPGYPDDTLAGRDCRAGDGYQQRRVDELHLLSQPGFLEACRRAGFTLTAPSRLVARVEEGIRHVA